MNRKKDKNNDKSVQKKLLELHRTIIALEKLEISRNESIISSTEMKKACRDLFNKPKSHVAILQDRKIVFISPLMARLLGYTQKEMLNTSFASYVHPQEMFKLAGYYLQRISGREAPPIYNSIVKRKDGKDIRIELMAGIFPYYGKPADLIIVKELTD